MQRCMTINITINTNVISVHQEIGWMQAMNKLIIHIPYLQHKKANTAALQVVRLYTLLETCAHIMVWPSLSSSTQPTILGFVVTL